MQTMNLLTRKPKKEGTAGTYRADKELANRAAGGEESALEEIFLTHKDRVFSLCLRMAGNYHLAEDLLQDGFLRAFRNLSQFRGDSSLGTWLYRVVANTALSRFRQMNQEWVGLEEGGVETSRLSVPESNPGPQSCWQTVDLERAIARLPLGYRIVLILHDVEGWEHEEIATLHGFSVGNSKSQLHKARLKMRELLQSRENEPMAT
jgi:RNA polymerase sigma-70 factor, ECF subfamily